MFDRLIDIANNHSNLIAVGRAKRALRIRYGVNIPPRKEQRDPIWLSAHGM